MAVMGCEIENEKEGFTWECIENLIQPQRLSKIKCEHAKMM
jgi:hypothetical protein